jgi:predicted NUDIX family NTP pyrophosphohydrolase
MKKLSAGLLMYRTKNGFVEFFLVHPGGPFFKNKDDGYWSIPKGEPEDGEPDNLTVAIREFNEETSIDPVGPYTELGTITQKNGKVVHAWAFQGDWPDDKPIVCNTIDLEWPRNSGKIITIP